jgi:hypothetical protein
VTQTDVTYGQLDKVLRSLGFSCRMVNGKPAARHYEHKETGAFLSVPPFPLASRYWNITWWRRVWYSMNTGLPIQRLLRPNS